MLRGVPRVQRGLPEMTEFETHVAEALLKRIDVWAMNHKAGDTDALAYQLAPRVAAAIEAAASKQVAAWSLAWGNAASEGTLPPPLEAALKALRDPLTP